MPTGPCVDEQNRILYGEPNNSDKGASPASEASQDPAPTRHAPQTAEQEMREKSKYEASEPYRSRKGDRFT